MTRTHLKVGYAPQSNPAHTPQTAAQGIEAAFGMLEGRWKILILFHLFNGTVMRFSELERAIPDVSQKMLTQQLRQLESDGIVMRVVHAEVPPRVEYRLTEWGETLCPALDSLLAWAERKPSTVSE
ncbi:winged helix-turn-helix transcriptional regulator [Undibacter mobilis]|uniref:Transcriptional regulator n=1 Tax=Undibacter mobilis TaxID=2292256 RepID=A0A371B9D7_9BRAD|nr:helix-turn-helix domain-containing protein [Undibacter mobilis]RDV03991.1 transcriptional regulator [Undibacter mobilis]